MILCKYSLKAKNFINKWNEKERIIRNPFKLGILLLKCKNQGINDFRILTLDLGRNLEALK